MYADKEKRREYAREYMRKKRGVNTEVNKGLTGMDAHMRRSWEGVAREWVRDPEGMRRLIGPLAKKEMEARKNGGDETYIVRWGVWGPSFADIAEVFL